MQGTVPFRYSYQIPSPLTGDGLPGGAGAAPGGRRPEGGAGAEAWFRALAERNADMLVVTDRSGRLLYANPAAERALGFCAAERPGLSVVNLVHPLDRQRAKAAFFGPAPAGEAQQPSPYRFRTGQKEWRVLEVVATDCLDHPGIGGIVLAARDTTERANLSRALATLGQCNQVLVRAGDETALLAETCATIVGAGGYPLAWVGYAEHDEHRTVREAASAGRTGYLAGLNLNWGLDEPAGQLPTGTCIRTGTVQVLKDTHLSKKFRPWLERAERHGFRSACALPLKAGGATLGALVIYAAERGAFGPAALELLCQLADDLGYGVGRLRDAAALQASEERFRLLADQAPIGIMEGGPDGITYVNPWVAEICGQDAGSLAGRGWMGAVHPDDLPAMVALADGAGRGPAPVGAGVRILRPDGEVRHARFLSVARAGPATPGGW